jgi:hypothetical protein
MFKQLGGDCILRNTPENQDIAHRLGRVQGKGNNEHTRLLYRSSRKYCQSINSCYYIGNVVDVLLKSFIHKFLQIPLLSSTSQPPSILLVSPITAVIPAPAHSSYAFTSPPHSFCTTLSPPNSRASRSLSSSRLLSRAISVRLPSIYEIAPHLSPI